MQTPIPHAVLVLRRTMPAVDLGDDSPKIVDPRRVPPHRQKAYAAAWYQWLAQHAERESWMIGLEEWCRTQVSPKDDDDLPLPAA